MWPNPQERVDFVTFIEENLNGKLHFLCSVKSTAHNLTSHDLLFSRNEERTHTDRLKVFFTLKRKHLQAFKRRSCEKFPQCTGYWCNLLR